MHLYEVLMMKMGRSPDPDFDVPVLKKARPSMNFEDANRFKCLRNVFQLVVLSRCKKLT